MVGGRAWVIKGVEDAGHRHVDVVPKATTISKLMSVSGVKDFEGLKGAGNRGLVQTTNIYMQDVKMLQYAVRLNNTCSVASKSSAKVLIQPNSNM